MREKEKSKLKTVPVYIITETGAGYNDEGLQKVTDMVFDKNGKYGNAPGPLGYGLESANGIFAHMGDHLLRSDLMAQNLKENPTARVILSAPDNVILCAYGPEPEGLPALISIFEDAAAKGQNSYEALMMACGYRKTE